MLNIMKTKDKIAKDKIMQRLAMEENKTVKLWIQLSSWPVVQLQIALWAHHVVTFITWVRKDSSVWLSQHKILLKCFVSWLVQSLRVFSHSSTDLDIIMSTAIAQKLSPLGLVWYSLTMYCMLLRPLHINLTHTWHYKRCYVLRSAHWLVQLFKSSSPDLLVTNTRTLPQA